jgi:hypothetical protein
MNQLPRLPQPKSKTPGPGAGLSAGGLLALGGVLFLALCILAVLIIFVPGATLWLSLAAACLFGLFFVLHYLLWGRLLEQWARQQPEGSAPERFWLRHQPPTPAPRDDLE